jgi:hypothetical protein
VIIPLVLRQARGAELTKRAYTRAGVIREWGETDDSLRERAAHILAHAPPAGTNAELESAPAPRFYLLARPVRYVGTGKRGAHGRDSRCRGCDLDVHGGDHDPPLQFDEEVTHRRHAVKLPTLTVLIDHVVMDVTCDSQDEYWLTAGEARVLAAALTEAADELDRDRMVRAPAQS